MRKITKNLYIGVGTSKDEIDYKLSQYGVVAKLERFNKRIVRKLKRRGVVSSSEFIKAVNADKAASFELKEALIAYHNEVPVPELIEKLYYALPKRDKRGIARLYKTIGSGAYKDISEFVGRDNMPDFEVKVFLALRKEAFEEEKLKAMRSSSPILDFIFNTKKPADGDFEAYEYAFKDYLKDAINSAIYNNEAADDDDDDISRAHAMQIYRGRTRLRELKNGIKTAKTQASQFRAAGYAEEAVSAESRVAMLTAELAEATELLETLFVVAL